jgi:hypothetical protein
VPALASRALMARHGLATIVQGEDMGMRSRLRADIGPAPASAIRVGGMARQIVTPA